MPNVYIPNRSIHNFSPAKKFGNLIFLSNGNMRKVAVSRAFRQFHKILKHSKADDYLLISGLTMLNLVACYILTKLHGRINLLIFRTTEGGKKYYLERTLDWNDELEF